MNRHAVLSVLLFGGALALVSCTTGTTVVVTRTATTSPTVQLLPTHTPTLEISPTPRVIPSDAERFNVYCNCDERATPQDFVAVTWIWAAESEDLVQAFLDTATFSVTIDGVPLAEPGRFMGPVEPYDGGDYDLDGRADFYVRWLYGLGRLESGIHTVRLSLNFSQQLTDGFDLDPQDGVDDLFGPGLREFFVRITVS